MPLVLLTTNTQKHRLQGNGVIPNKLIQLTMDNIRRNIDLDLKYALSLVKKNTPPLRSH